MLHILHGQDDFSLREAVARIKGGLGAPEMVAANLSSLDGEHLTLKQLEDNCSATPFLCAARLVIVTGLLGCFEPKLGRSQGGKRSVTKIKVEGAEWQGLDSYIRRMPPTTVLILIDGKLSSRNPLLVKLSPLAEVQSFPLLRGRDLRAWIQQRATKDGGSITPQAVGLLAELIGGDLWAMGGEIDKLLLYAEGRTIDEEDVRRSVSHAQEAGVFALVDAVLEGRFQTAQRALHRLSREVALPTYILAMIARQLRLIAQVKGMSPGSSRKHIQETLGVASAYAMDKVLKQAKLYDLQRIAQTYRRLSETDLAIKTGKYSDRLALELLIAELCQE
jgi:DNA polymerase-3 subunit delta